MCLIIKKGTRLRTAKKDIKVYKILSKCESKTVTPWIRTEVKSGMKMSVDEMTKDFRGDIEEGIHAFMSYRMAARVLLNWSYWRTYGDNFLIVESVIPKGAKYYLGNSDDIVSDRLILGGF